MGRDPDGHYAALGVDPSASPAEVRTAYLRMARRHHPDRLADRPAAEQRSAASTMARINEAWAVLGDAHRRATYDGAFEPRPRAHVRDAGSEFRALDDDGDEWVDPRLLDDTPSGPPLQRPLTFLPVGLGASGLGLVLAGWFFAFEGLVVVGVGALFAAALAFVLIPLLVMIDSSRSDRRR